MPRNRLFTLRGYYPTDSDGVQEAEIHGFFGWGQSNARARGNTPYSSSVDNLYRPNGGFQTGPTSEGGQSNHVSDAQVQTWDNFSGAWVSRGAAHPIGEGWAHGLAATIQQVRTQVEKVGHYSAAVGSKHWREIMPGTGIYGTLGIALRAFVLWASSLGYADSQIKVHCLIAHGEADADTTAPGGGTSEARVDETQYRSICQQMVDGWRHLCRLVFDDWTRTDPVFFMPLGSGNYLSGGRAVQSATIYAMNNVAGFNLLPSPQPYYADGDALLVHYDGEGKRRIAEASAVIIDRVSSGTPWKPLHVPSGEFTRSGTTVTVVFNRDVEEGDLAQIDATDFPDQHDGFEFFDDGTHIEITNVAYADDTATITLASAPTGTETMRIGQHETDYGATKPTTFWPRVNVRAVETLGVGPESDTLYDYAIPQSLAKGT